MTEDEIRNDPRFKAMERGYRSQCVAVQKVFANIIADELGADAYDLFILRVFRSPPAIVPRG